VHLIKPATNLTFFIVRYVYYTHCGSCL